MTKVCCIVNCKSKCPDIDSNERKLFAVPHNAQRRQLWFDAISSYLREGRKNRKHFYVCDLHFEEDNILKNYSILLKNGLTDTIPRFVVTLKPSSVPSIFNNEKEVRKKAIDSPVAEKKISLQATLACEVEREAGLTLEWKKVTGLVGDVEREPEYSLEMLDNDLKNIWANQEIHTWGGTMIYSGLILSYYGNRTVRDKTILVKKDMTVEIRADGKVYMKSFKEKIMCLDDALSLMAEVEKKNRCPGSNDITPCPEDFIESSLKSSSNRCSSCRVKRKQHLNNLSRIERRSLLKQNKIKQLVKNLKRKNERLLKSIASMNENIAELKFRCATASEDVIDNTMKLDILFRLSYIRVKN